MNYNEVTTCGKYKLHHISKNRGYVPRKLFKSQDFEIEQYDGYFGKGYKAHVPVLYSTQYHDVEYWIKKVAE